jgi:hypothetical protein
VPGHCGLVDRLADALHHPAMDLTCKCQLVDEVANNHRDDALVSTSISTSKTWQPFGKFEILSEKPALRIRKTVAPRL